MSKQERAAARMRVEIVNAKRNDTFINRNVVFVMFEEGQERSVHLPHMKYFNFVSNS